MTYEIFLVLAILCVALALLASAAFRTDVIALLVLGALAVTGIVTPAEAVSGFSNAAVIAVIGMFILSAALTRAGIANMIGRSVMRVAGRREGRVAAVVMIVAGTLSFFMNRIGVAALMMPVVVDLAQRRRIAASRLLMPLSQATVLGGLTTLVANPPNLLIGDALSQAGAASFGVLDFLPLGLPLLAVGIAYMVLIGRRMLPLERPEEPAPRRSQRNLRMQYGLQPRNIALRVKRDSILIGKTLKESRIASAAGLFVMALERYGRTELMPSSKTRLAPGDKLIVQGRLDRIQEFHRWSALVIEREAPVLQQLMSAKIGLVEMTIEEGSPLESTLLDHAEFRKRFQATVLGLRRGDQVRRANLAQIPLKAGDKLLLQARAATAAELERGKRLGSVRAGDEEELKETYRLQERLFVVRVPRESALAGETLARSRFASALDFHLLGLFREGELSIMPDADAVVQGGDLLLIQGKQEDLDALRGLQELEIVDAGQSGANADSELLGMIEATPDPRSSVVGHRLEEIGFREKYGLEVAGVWRKGEAIRANLEALVLQLGDALLLVGPRDKLQRLDRDPDFVILTPLVRRLVDARKAPIAAAIVAGVVVAALVGFLPIHVAALVGATLMIASGCLPMEDAYRAVDWQVIFVVAGLLPLGVAMDHTGAARLVAEHVMAVLEPMGAWWTIGGLYLITAAANLVVPGPALVVLMSPIVLSTSAHLGIAPQTAMMAVAMAASASFVSPLSHSAHLMVMGPGGYRIGDYVKVGLPLALLSFALVMLLLPWVWPLVPAE